MSDPEFRFRHRLRVRWAEVDMQKIVFNGHYLMYFDTAVADYWRALAMPYEAAMHELNGDLYVKKASVEYHASAVYDERLDIAVRCARLGNSSMQFVGQIERVNSVERQVLITAELIYVFADPASQTSKPIPAALRECLESFERGEPTWRVEPLVGEAWQQATSAFASSSFGAASPLQVGSDGLRAVNRLNQTIAIASQTDKWARVSPVLRGQGLGQQLLATNRHEATARSG